MWKAAPRASCLTGSPTAGRCSSWAGWETGGALNQLRREIQGVSAKVLSQTLKKLERDGLVRREAFPTVPVTVEYEITELGATLRQTVAGLTRWAEDNIERVLDAQRRYNSGAS